VAFDISVRPRVAAAPQTAAPAAPSAAPPAAASARTAVTAPLLSMLEDPSFDPEATVVIPGRARLLADMHARQGRAAAPPAAEPPPPAVAEKPPVTDAASDAVPEDADWVMVVDDNLAVREFMRTKLQPFRLNVDYATSGEEAIGLTAKRHYACVFLDVVMPGIDGHQVCKMVKTRKSAKPTAVVLLTSKGSPFDRIKGKMAGCDAYLTKPVDEEKLLEVIARFLQTTTTA
jgi:twitching motility two-component system response regulator PilG